MLRRLAKSSSGNVMMVAALSMPIMIGAAGLASDTVSWALTRRQLQREADSAAMAGAYALAQAKDPGDAARHDITQVNDVVLSSAAIVNNAPTSGAYAGNVNAVGSAQRLWAVLRTRPRSSEVVCVKFSKWRQA